jgi:hypothetical protein
MFEINKMFQKIRREQSDTSIMFEVPKQEQEAKAKITIEIPGQAPVVLDELDEHLVFTRSGNQMGCVGLAALSFLLQVFKVIKRRIDETICNKFGV